MRVKLLRIIGSALALLLINGGCAYHSGFTDRKLEERFRAHESEFKKLVEMFKEDSKLSRVNHEAAYEANDAKAVLSPDRVADYHGLLSKLNVTSITKRAATRSIYFAVWRKNDFPAGGTNEYIVYSERPPAEAQYLVESLDNLRGKTDAFAFKKIAERWYLHLDNW